MMKFKPEAVRVTMLGGFSIRVGSRIIGHNEWRLKRTADLMKLLALAPHHSLHREQVMEALWSHLERRAASNNLRRTLHAARSALDQGAGSHYIASEEGRLVLCSEGKLWVDVDSFEEAAATARREREPTAYRAALELYAGELLPADRYEEWTEERRQKLRQLNLTLLAELASIHEQRGDYRPAIEALRRLTTEEPAREEAHAGLMRLYALSGRQFEALQQYGVLEGALAREVGAEPDSSSRTLRKEIARGNISPPAGGMRSEDDIAAAVPGVGKHNLSAPRTSFVGRRQEMVEVKRALAMTRLLTLTGAGGTGKTRLALEVCRDLVRAYPDGVWLVKLAPLPEGELVPKAVAEAVGTPEQPGRRISDTLVESMRDKERLLVVDNCEHLIDATAKLVDTLLEACPRLRVLATSREPLDVAGELNWLVPSLSVPDEGTSTVEEVEGHESSRLFVARASYRSREFSVTPENAWAVAEICRRLDGIPLAVELAAARVGPLSVGQIAQRLDESLMLLTGGSRTVEMRHRTLRATLDWSCGLLSEEEKELFERLSVFMGGWTLEAAEAVGAGGGVEEEEVLDLLSRLVEKSLVVAAQTGEGGARYRLLEPVRQYAMEKLEESGEAEAAKRTQTAYFLALAERAEPELMGNEPAAWLAVLGTEVGNLRAALSRTLDAEQEPGDERVETGLRLANALARFWDTQGPGEGRRWLEKGLAHNVEVPPPVRAEALREAGLVAVYEGDALSIPMVTEALELYTEIGDQPGMLATVDNLGHALAHHADPETAAAVKAEVEVLLAGSGDRTVVAHLAHFLGFAAAAEKDYDEMVLRLEEALALYRELGDTRNVALCLPSLGFVTLVERGFEEAEKLFEEGLALERRIKYKTAIYFHLMGLAAVATHRDHLRRAAKLYGAGEVLREATGLSPKSLANARYDYEGYLATVRAGLGDPAFDAAFSVGRHMSTEQAIEYALGAEDTSPRAVPDPRAAPLSSLTRREQEVALLVAQGLTNRHIARELTVSEHTVENHVAHVLKKLDLHSREQISSPHTQH